MMAAGQAAACGASSVTLLERNDRLGKKLSITGKGRGNITNILDVGEMVGRFPGNGAFLYGALCRFSNEDLRRFFAGFGVDTVEDRGGRVFPASGKASDLVAALERFMVKSGVCVLKNRRVTGIIAKEGRAAGVACAGEKMEAEAVIAATGGASYPATGSTGDGYHWARELGHTVIRPRPALAPLETEERWVRELTGLALKNVTAQLLADGRIIAEEFGEMLFTHYGLSGPIILSLSRDAVSAMDRGQQTSVRLNLKPALTPKQLDDRLLRDFTKYSRKMFKNSLEDLLPQRLINAVVMLSGVAPDLPVNQISKAQRRQLLDVLTGLTLTVRGVRPLREAIVTAGGVSVREIDPATMESKILRGLYFAGEIIDVDGYTGGYNLQAAFSTGFAAGTSAVKKE